MGGMSDYLEREILDHIFSAAAYSAPATIYCSLHTASPADTGANEMSAGNYARKSFANNATNWPAATGTGGTKANGAAITFTTAATTAWGTATHFGWWDAATAGNFLWWGTLTASKVIGINDQLKFNTSAMNVTIG